MHAPAGRADALRSAGARARCARPRRRARSATRRRRARRRARRGRRGSRRRSSRREQALRREHLGVRDRRAHVVARRAVRRARGPRRPCSARTRSSSGSALVPEPRHQRLACVCCPRGAQAFGVVSTTSVPVPSLVNTSASRLSGCEYEITCTRAHAARERALDRGGLRQHAAPRSCPPRAAAQARDDRCTRPASAGRRALEDSRRAGGEHELLGLELGADRGRDGVGVDVEQRAVVVGRQRAHDRHEAVVELLHEDARVDAVECRPRSRSRPSRRADAAPAAAWCAWIRPRVDAADAHRGQPRRGRPRGCGC